MKNYRAFFNWHGNYIVYKILLQNKIKKFKFKFSYIVLSFILLKRNLINHELKMNIKIDIKKTHI